MRSDPSDLGSLILIRTIPMECTIKFLGLPLKESKVLLPERNGRIFSAWDSSSNNACLASLLWKTRWFHHRRYTSWTILYNKVKTFTIKFDSPYTYQRALDSRTRTTTNTKFLSVLSSARVWASVILAGKRDNRRHSATSLSENGRENVVVAGAGYQMWDVLSFCYRERA